MTYAEDININNPISYIMNKAKNISYLGFGAFNSLDILFMILIFMFFYFIKKYIYQKIKIILFNNNVRFTPFRLNVKR